LSSPVGFSRNGILESKKVFCSGKNDHQYEIFIFHFCRYPVSNFSYDLLERMWFDSLFRLGYINPLLYRRCRQLNKVLELRLQLINVAEFLRICRFGTEYVFVTCFFWSRLTFTFLFRVWEDFRKKSADWLEDPEIYSLYDLTRVNSGELFQLLRQIVSSDWRFVHLQSPSNPLTARA